MPNWKTYDSAIRLLSAVLAADPERKLNYQDIAQAFGGDCTGSALENRFRRIKADAKAIQEALKRGIDPITVEMTSNGAKKDIATRFGDGTAKAGMQFRFRRVKQAAILINEAVSKGVDPHTVDFDLIDGKCNRHLHGCGMNKKAAWDRLAPLKKDAQALKDALENGIDTSTITVGVVKRNPKEYIAAHIGDGCTAKAVQHRFAILRSNAKVLHNAVVNGEDPATINLPMKGGIDEICKYLGESTPSGLQHRFRPIKVDAHAMIRVADQYGEGVTAKAVSTRMERAKKEPGWIGGKNSNGDDEEDEFGLEQDEDNKTPVKTPTKRRKNAPLNKTKEGRVNKKVSPKKNNGAAIADFAAKIELSDDDDPLHSSPVKSEGGNGMREILEFAGKGDYIYDYEDDDNEEV